MGQARAEAEPPPCQVNFRKVFLTTASWEKNLHFLMSLPTVPPTPTANYRTEDCQRGGGRGGEGTGVDVSPIWLERVIGTTSLLYGRMVILALL